MVFDVLRQVFSLQSLLATSGVTVCVLLIYLIGRKLVSEEAKEEARATKVLPELKEIIRSECANYLNESVQAGVELKSLVITEEKLRETPESRIIFNPYSKIVYVNTPASLSGRDEERLGREVRQIKDLMSGGEYTKAHVQCRKMKAKFPEKATLYFLEGDTFIREGRILEARTELEIAHDMRPNELDELFYNSILLDLERDGEEAMRLCLKAHRHFRKDIRFTHLLGYLEWKYRDDLRQALHWAQMTRANDDRIDEKLSIMVLNNLAWFHAEIGTKEHVQEAMKLHAELGKCPDSAMTGIVLDTLGYVLLRSFQTGIRDAEALRGALRHFEEALHRKRGDERMIKKHLLDVHDELKKVREG